MPQFRRLLASAQEFLGKMTVSQKLLIGSLAVIAGMAFFLVAQYASRPGLVDLFAGGEGGDAQTVSLLRAANLNAKFVNGRVMVPEAEQSAAIATLASSGGLPTDTTILFKNMLDRQGFYYSKQQNEQLFVIALQNELARIIGNFNDVREASVLLDVPEPGGIGRQVRQPTASATVFTRSGRALEQAEVDAIAELITGARAGLTTERVRVIDGSAGRQRRPTNKDDIIPATYLEHSIAVENQLREKIADLLSYIPGCTVAVTAQVDVSRVNSQSVRFLPKDDGTTSVPSRSNSSTMTQSAGSRGAEPGVRSNAQADITGSASGAPSGPTTADEQEEKGFETRFGSETTSTIDPRGMPTRLAASINIPRGYVAALLTTDPAAPPTEQDIEARFQIERKKIEDSVRPHVQGVSEAGTAAGEVVVTMIPIDVALPAGGASQAGWMSGLTGGASGGAGGLVEKGLLALLALGAVGLMLTMVRKSGKPIELPTAQELSGVPPTLPNTSDLVGEAEESEAAMTGIEIGDDTIRARKIVEQVEEMVASDPSNAARLLGRWITNES